MAGPRHPDATQLGDQGGVSLDMRGTLTGNYALRRTGFRALAHGSTILGEFVFVPASSAVGGINGTLRSVDKEIPLTWSAPALEEFVTTMHHIEHELLSSWEEVDRSGGAAGGQTGPRRHA